MKKKSASQLRHQVASTRRISGPRLPAGASRPAVALGEDPVREDGFLNLRVLHKKRSASGLVTNL